MVALYVLETAPVDELWFVPAYEHAFGKPLAPFADRLRCASCAAPRCGRASASASSRGDRRAQPDPADGPPPAELHPEHAFSLVIGSDLQGDIASWYGGDELQRTVPFIVVGGRAAGSPPAGSAARWHRDARRQLERRSRRARGRKIRRGARAARGPRLQVRKGLYQGLA
jgi:nicotinate-nucleotide adenylyltransferase